MDLNKCREMADEWMRRSEIKDREFATGFIKLLIKLGPGSILKTSKRTVVIDDRAIEYARNILEGLTKK